MSNVKGQSSLAKISVIVPVKDEADSIRQLLQGLSAQTYQPSEIVITDGGSMDGTREIIRDYQSSSAIPIVLIETEDALPGRGRNLAIARAANEWIASIDAGIRPRPDWLHHLIAAAEREPQAEVIYGVARPITDTYFTECAAITYLPGGGVRRSIASCLLRRAAWEKVGGFREDLRSGEDLLFFQGIDATGVPTRKCPEAVVLWELRPTLAGTFRRFAAYSRSGIRAGLAREWQYNVSRLYLLMLIPLLASWWFWPLLLAPVVILLVRATRRIRAWYLAESPSRVGREMLNPLRVSTVALIGLVIDLATLFGMWLWFRHDRFEPRGKVVKGDATG